MAHILFNTIRPARSRKAGSAIAVVRGIARRAKARHGVGASLEATCAER
jgi:hypothetical protein